MEMTDSDTEEMPVGAGAPLVAPDGQVFVQEVSGALLPQGSVVAGTQA